MSTPERPDRGDAPRERRKENIGASVSRGVAEQREGQRRSGTERRVNQHASRYRNYVGPNQRTERSDRRRSPEDVREADVGEARAPNSDDAADWIAWLSDQSAGGYADITVPGERILELVRALEDPASAAGRRFEVQGRVLGFDGVLAAPALTNDALTLIRSTLTVAYCELRASISITANPWNTLDSARGDTDIYRRSAIPQMLDEAAASMLQEMEWWDEITAEDAAREGAEADIE